MAIKFKCPKCGKELTVKDELAGRQGKCPFCKTVVTVPAANRPKPASALAPARKPAPRPAPVEEEEVIDAEVVEEEEEVVEAEVMDDEPAPKRGSSRDTSPDDFDFPSKKSSAPARRTSRRDDDDEEEDERPRSKSRRRDEEEDERPRKKSRRRDEDDRPSRKASSRRKRDDDYDDEEEDDDPKARKARARARRAAYRRAGTGAQLTFIGMACYTGAWALLTVISLILSVMALVGAGRGGFDLLRVVGYVMDGLLVINWVLFVVGSCFLIFDPGKNGEKGLAITILILSVLVLVGYLYMRFASGVEMVLLLLLAVFGAMGFGSEVPILIYFWPLLELARLCLFGFYCKAVATSQKEKELESSSMMLSMAVPGALFGFVVVMWIMVKIVAAAQSEALLYLAWFIMDSMLGGITGLLAWYTMNSQIVKDTLDEAK